MRRRRPRRLVAAGLVLLAMLAAAALQAVTPTTRIVVEVAPALLALSVGAAAALLALVVPALRGRGEQRVAAAALVAREQAAVERRRFLARLDHELKNPVQAIRAGLAAAPPDPALQIVDGQAVRLARLVADLRKLADLEQRPLDVASVDVAALLRDAVEDAGALPGAAERRMRLVLPEAPRPLPAVLGDPDLLAVAVDNLLANAVKFSPVGAVVEVRAREEPAAVVVEVADTGPGVPAEEVDLVWEELGRGHAAAGLPGSGLGLPLVRIVAARHGGAATLRSGPGGGTVVSVVLPTA